MSNPQEEHVEPVIRDKRRIDPTTGLPREHQPSSTEAKGEAAAPAAASPELDQVRTQLAERTADLQRLQAEYANYRKRVERDRQAVGELALANVLANLLPVLDDVGRARAHGELEGGFKSVAEALEAIVTKLGLTPFGEAGDPFDPTVHDAMLHNVSAEVTEPTCTQVFEPGYKLGERVIRPARVAVTDPVAADEAAVPETPTETTAETTAETS